MITEIKYTNLDALEIINNGIKMVVVYEIGPRIAYFGKEEGPNLLYWAPEDVKRKDWKLYGGHRVWLTRPYADESEDTYFSDNKRCQVDIEKNEITITAKVCQINNLIRSMKITILENGKFKVDNLIKNAGDLIYSGGVWSPTCVVAKNRRMIVPLGDENSTWDIVSIVIPRVFAGNSTILEDNQVSFEKNDLVITPKGHVVKRACLSKQGRVILDCGNYKFIKYSNYDPRKNYPLGGCNVALFNGDDDWMSELETYGEVKSIIPGETIDNSEIWYIE
jgi:hypothetical protein